MSNERENRLLEYDKLTGLTGFQAEMIAILHNTVAKETTVSELAYFLSVCKAINLNPLNREVWCYKDNQGNLLVFTGRDGFLKKAQENPNYNGLRSSEVCEGDIFRMDIANNKISHEFNNKDRGNIIGGYAIVFVKNAEPTIEWAHFDTYNKGRNTWLKFPADMIKKVAECHALKKAFGITNLASEYDFEIKDSIAYPGKYVESDSQKENKIDERVEKLIDSSKTKESLEKLFNKCNTPELKQKYDQKFKTFK